MSRILVVEDNGTLALGLRGNLEYDGHRADVVPSAEAALTRLTRQAYDLVILDLMLPGMDGFRLVSLLRSMGQTVPILVLTARGDEGDKVRVLKAGADDYVTKPFGLHELLARVEARLRRAAERRTPPARLSGYYRFGDIEVDAGRREVRRRGELVVLRPKEFDLLLALLGRRGQVATRRELMHEVWGYHESSVSRTLDTHVAELRRRLEDDAASPAYIMTVRKSGYRIAGEIEVKE
jgi:two-component system alkaline phosphatase synthesis response regulator PhoP